MAAATWKTGLRIYRKQCVPRPHRAVILPRRCLAWLIALSLIGLPLGLCKASSRIKDIASFEGVRDNLLVGYGLVAGLKGTGDDLDDARFTALSLVGMLDRMGIKVDSTQVDDVKNIAAVVITAVLDPFSRQGSRLDVTVSAMGTAKSLAGGTLLVTPLRGADGEVYAVAQGQVAVGGFTAQGQAQSVTRGVPTNGRIANGAIVEREIGFELAALDEIKLALRNPDFTTARRMAQGINAFLGQESTQVLDSGTVVLSVPVTYQGDVVGLITDIEQLRIEPDQPARVVVDEQSGIIVMGENVRIATVAVAQGNLTVRITETPQVSQPNPFAPAGAQTTTVPRTQIDIDDGSDRKLGIVDGGVSLQELVNGLNALGIGPRDMISILQAIKAAGALQADLEVM